MEFLRLARVYLDWVVLGFIPAASIVTAARGESGYAFGVLGGVALALAAHRVFEEARK